MAIEDLIFREREKVTRSVHLRVGDASRARRGMDSRDVFAREM